MKRKSTAAIFVLAALALAGCGGSDEPEVQQEPFDLVIGDSIPLTGQYSDLGRSGPPETRAANSSYLVDSADLHIWCELVEFD